MRKMKFVAMALTAALALQFTVPAFAAQLPETEAAPSRPPPRKHRTKCRPKHWRRKT